MWHLTKLALRNRIVTIVIALAIAGVSIWAFTGLKVELLPDISFPYTTVVTIYPQAAPQDVADEVTEPIEKFIWDEWQNEGLKHVTSTSVSGMSIIMAEFEFGTDMDKVGDRLKEGVSRLELPQAVLAVSEMMGNGTENPQIIPINMNVMPLVSLSLSGDLSPEEIKLITEQQIVPELSKVDGVLRVDAEGVDQEQVLISPDPDEMTRYGISMAQIAGLIQTSNSSIDAVKNTVLDSSGTRLSDISSVVLSPPLSSAIIRTNGKPSVGISLTKTEEANTVETAEAIQAKVAELQAELGDKVTIETIFDQSDFINASINQLWEKAVVGAILAVLVVFLFLRALRASLITAISIPLSVFIGFLCMRLTGITINLLTLSAITIAIGRLIDDSIVILEVIFRHLRQGESFKEAAINGAREVANPVTTATLATVAIFIPLIFVGGIVGEIFIPFALTVTFAMLASLLVALMLIPAMARLIGSSKNKITEIKDNWYQKVYVKALKWTLNHRVGVVVIAIVLLVVSVGLLPVTGTSFMSGAMGEPTINVSIALPPGTDIKTTDEITAEVENILKDTPAIKSYQSKIGTSSSLTGLMSTAQGGGSNTAAIVAYLNSEADVQQETAELTRRCAEIQHNGSILVSGSESGSDMELSSASLSLSVQGRDQEKVAVLTNELMQKLQTVAGIDDLKSDLTTVTPKLTITPDTAKIAASGLSMEQMAMLQQEYLLLMNGGTLPGKTVSINGDSYAVYLDGLSQKLKSVEQAQALNIGFPVTLKLGDLANVSIEELPSHISHTDTMLSATITGTITDKDVGAVNREVQQVITALPEHEGVDIQSGGIFEQMDETFNKMFIAIIIAIVIVFVIVILMMRSIINPLIIMVSLPLAFIGSIPALLVSGHTLGVSALMGLLMLIGIVLTNAIVLITMVEEQRRAGVAVDEALISGGKTRLRPILMTALTTILAMIPMAIFVSSGTMLSAELAIVVIGGMFSSTLLTLLVIPAIYSLIHRRKQTKSALR